MRILVIQSDAETSWSLELVLRGEGFKVETCDTGDDGIDVAKIYEHELILLDGRLADMTGLEALRRLRAAKVGTNVIILGASDRVEDKVAAFTAGADDYLIKPFHRDELVARMLAIVRRVAGASRPVIEVGPIEVDLHQHVVSAFGRPLHLTGKEFGMMEAMALRKGQVLSKEALMNHLYGGMDEPELKIIDVFICKLRKKLETAGAKDHVETVWGQGYRLVAAPTEVAERREPARRTITPLIEVVLASLSAGDMSFRAIVASLDGRSSVSVRGALARLMDRGEVVNVGGPRSGVYRLVSKQVAA
jgi:two-component system cell cycle response regulator CtrA